MRGAGKSRPVRSDAASRVVTEGAKSLWRERVGIEPTKACSAGPSWF